MIQTNKPALLLPLEDAMKKRHSKQKGILDMKSGRHTLRYEVRSLASARGWTWKREYLPFDCTKPQAETYRKKRMAEVNRDNNSGVEKPILTLQTFTETLWALYLDKQDARPSTRVTYASILKGFILPNFGSLKLTEITPTRISQFFGMINGKVSTKYALNIFGVMRTLFEVALAHDLIPTSPIKAKLHRPKHEDKAKTSYTAEQVQAIVAAIPDEHKLFILTGAVTGLRLGELLGLRWTDIDSGFLAVEHGVFRGTLQGVKTRSSKQRLSIPAELSVLLEAKRGADDAYVFSSSTGRTLDPDYMRERVLYPALRKAGIEIKPRQNGFHAFRHTAGSLLYEITRDIQAVKGLLRHSKISTTSDVYTHVSGSVQGEGSDKLMDLFSLRGALEDIEVTPLVN